MVRVMAQAGSKWYAVTVGGRTVGKLYTEPYGRTRAFTCPPTGRGVQRRTFIYESDAVAWLLDQS